jgi:hypothetical protein
VPNGAFKLVAINRNRRSRSIVAGGRNHRYAHLRPDDVRLSDHPAHASTGRDDVRILKSIQGMRRKSSICHLAMPVAHFRWPAWYSTWVAAKDAEVPGVATGGRDAFCRGNSSTAELLRAVDSP